MVLHCESCAVFVHHDVVVYCVLQEEFERLLEDQQRRCEEQLQQQCRQERDQAQVSR